MLKINRILCPIDFSESSVKAYDYAESLSWHYKPSLWIEELSSRVLVANSRNSLGGCREVAEDAFGLGCAGANVNYACGEATF